VAAIAHLGDLFCAVHYVCPGIGRLALTDELTIFSNQIARFPGAKRAFVFAGESYQDILTELETDTQTDTKLISYGGAYQCLQLPIHLLSCDAIAALKKQARTALVPRFQDNGTARIFALTDEAVTEVTGKPPVPYVPPRAPFFTTKGDVVDTPALRVPGKAGGQAGRKARLLG